MELSDEQVLKSEQPTPAKRIWLVVGALFLCFGEAILGVGIAMLLMKSDQAGQLQDGEYLVSAKNWVMDEGTNCADAASAENTATNCASSPSVIWDFTETGKGTLTTNGHINDYDFIWAIEDGKLKIETNWLYQLNNTYDYELDQGAGTLKLTAEGEEHLFHAVKDESGRDQ